MHGASWLLSRIKVRASIPDWAAGHRGNGTVLLLHGPWPPQGWPDYGWWIPWMHARNAAAGLD
eukprot:1157302-Pelagomonas_calceolata.AAC.18